MAIINTCCCGFSLRRGSFACAFYTLIYHTIMVIGGTFQVDTMEGPSRNETSYIYSLGQSEEASYSITVTIVTCSGLTVLSSVTLLIGLCMNNRLMLLPWIMFITITTFVDFVYTFYLLGTMVINPYLAIVVTADVFIGLLNVYCFLCVVSLYQEYRDSRIWTRENLQIPSHKDTAPYTVTNYKRSVQFSERDHAIRKAPPVISRSSGPEKSSEVGRENEGQFPNETSGNVPLKCVHLNGRTSSSTSEMLCDIDTSECSLDLGLWTADSSCDGSRETRRSSARHVQFHPTIEEVDSLSDGVQVSQTQPGNDETCPNELDAFKKDIRMMSFSTSTNETSPLLEQKLLTTNL